MRAPQKGCTRAMRAGSSVHSWMVRFKATLCGQYVPHLNEFNQCLVKRHWSSTMHAFGVTRTCAKLCAWSKRRWLNTIQLSLWDCVGKYEARFQGLEAAVSGVSIGVIYRIFKSEGCWWEMPGDREDEICGKALELLSDLCSRGEVQDDNCLDFTYYFRDLGRPRYSDSGEYFVLCMSKIYYCSVSVRFCLS